MRSRKTIHISSYILLAFSLFLTASLWAAGGGGGGGGGGLGSSGSSGPRIDPAEKYQEGLTALQEQRYKKAERAFKSALSVAKRDANMTYLLGLSYVGQERYKPAKRALEKAIKYDKALISARGRLGYVYKALEDEEKAQAQLKVLQDMAEKCGDCGDKAEIDRSIRILNSYSAEEQSNRLDLPEKHYAHTQGGTPKRQETANKSYLAAVSLINTGHYQDALDVLADAALVVGPHADILTYQGFANRKLGNLDVAVDYYRAALDLYPDHRGANEYLGEYYVEVGQLDAARNQLEKLQSICQFGCEEAEELQRWINAAVL